MSKQKTSSIKKIQNRRASYDYQLDEPIIVGIMLTGAETKSLRLGHGQLSGAYVTVKNSELWLINAVINGTRGIDITESQQSQARKLLAKRREIDKLIVAKQQGKTIIPLELLTSNRYIKLKIATGIGKKKYDKRQVIKARDENRNIRREIR